MIIGFDAKRAFQNTRGLGNYSRNLISGLIQYYPNHKYILYGQKPNSGDIFNWFESLPDQLKVCVPGNSSKIYQPLWRSYFIKNNLKNDQLDIYHGLSHEIPLGLDQLKTKKIVTIHDLLFLRFKENFSRVNREIYLSKIKYSCRKADKVLAVSEQTKSDLIHFLNIPKEKIEVAYQSCSSLFYNKIEEQKKIAIKKKYNLPNDFLLYVGALVKHKNIERIIEAIALLPSDFKLPLVIVGSANSYKIKLIEKIRQLNLTNKVLFLDYVETADMPSIYQLASILVWPSLFEGFGIPIVEALFSNLPVITSNVGCFSEVGGEGSFYVDPTNSEEISVAIQEILSNTALAEQMKKKGSVHAQNFHIKHTTEKLMNIYNSI